MSLKRILISIFVWICHSTVSGQPFDFVREDLTFELDSTTFSVCGNYFIKNNTKVLQKPLIGYPLPTLCNCPLYESFYVFGHISDTIPLPVTVRDTFIYFRPVLMPDTINQISVIYRQQHNGNLARYILTTTSTWRKPLQHAVIKLVVPDYISILSLPEEPEKITEFEEKTVYQWFFSSFMPVNEFDIGFEVDIKNYERDQ